MQLGFQSENCQRQLARQPSLESYAFKAEVAGSQNVTYPCQAKEVLTSEYTSMHVQFTQYAGVAQLLERFLAKEEVESQSLFTRTKKNTTLAVVFFLVWLESSNSRILQKNI